MADLHWTAAQLEAITERQSELLVSAAAGSGKTAVLVERVLRLALGGGLEAVPLENMLVVTFTRAAASELLGRLHQALLKNRSAPPASGAYAHLANIRRQLSALPRAQISTIHSFCAEVIRRYGHTAGLELGPQLDAQEAALLRHELATELLDESLGESAAVRELALWWGGQDGVGPEDLSRVMYGRGLREPLLRLHDLYCSLVDPPQWEQEHVRLAPLAIEGPDTADPSVASLEAELLNWRQNAQSVHEQVAQRFGGLTPSPDYIELSTRRFRIAADITLANGWDKAAAAFRSLKEKQDDIKWKPTLLTSHKRDIEDEAARAWLASVHEPLAESAKELLGVLAEPWEQVAARENAARENLALLYDLMLEFDRRYSDHKRGRSLTDFNDLERNALRILALHDDARIMLDAAGRPLPSIAALEYRSRFEAVLVDEYQDTNSLQEAIIGLVTRDAAQGSGRPRFSVGDIKQSIYDFRGAEPGLFKALGEQLDDLPPGAGRVVRLAENFRSRTAVLSGINELFDGVMTEDLGGEDYPANRLLPGCDYGQLFSEQGAEPVEDVKPRLHLVALGGDHGGSAEGDSQSADEESMLKAEQIYRRVADVLRGIHGEGQAIYDKAAGTVRRVAWRDMAVLLRSARGRMETLRAVLDDAGIPYYAPARSGFYERPEVSDALSLLRVIDNPRQDIPLAAALSGPACGLDPAHLLELSRIKTDPPDGCLWDRAAACLNSDTAPELQGALARFGVMHEGWRRLARLEPLPVLLWDVFNRSGLLAAAAAMPGGQQRLANLYQLHELARNFASFERQGLARFMRYLEHSRRAQGDLGEAPLAGEGQDVVRVMTVHQAKGLEFPVVVIPDIDKQFNQADLRGDVLTHKDAGLGGRFVDMRADPPQRDTTLGLRRVKRIKQADLLSQELRVMYVALTRARERLELVAAVDAQKQQDAVQKRPAEANCWLDWIGCSLGDGIRAALASDEQRWEGEHWTVLAGPPEYAAAGSLPGAAVLSAADLASIESRLSLEYVHRDATAMPAKLTVTELAKQPQLAGEDDQPAFVIGSDLVGTSAVPALGLDAATGGAMARGTALHLLLAAIDPRESSTQSALKAELARLVERGLVEPELAATFDLGKLSAALELLLPHLNGKAIELHRELPFALLVPAGDPALAQVRGGVAAGPTTAADQVYVQGVIDLLVVDNKTALLVDYKSDRGAGADELLDRYRAQLEWYCRAVRAMLPGRTVSWALLGLAAPVLAGPFE